MNDCGRRNVHPMPDAASSASISACQRPRMNGDRGPVPTAEIFTTCRRGPRTAASIRLRWTTTWSGLGLVTSST